MLQTTQYIDTTYNITFNQFIEVFRNMPKELKEKAETILKKEIEKERKPTTAKKTRTKKAVIEENTSEIVAYTVSGKPLTKQEYIDEVLKACEETDKGNWKTIDEVFAKFENDEE